MHTSRINTAFAKSPPAKTWRQRRSTWRPEPATTWSGVTSGPRSETRCPGLASLVTGPWFSSGSEGPVRLDDINHARRMRDIHTACGQLAAYWPMILARTFDFKRPESYQECAEVPRQDDLSRID